ncbi:MAG: hypothetical protein FWC96_09385 [Oscillospiraceae bacterium]|nr:hypothetical protein [Oscillospiraceae bacterium]
MNKRVMIAEPEAGSDYLGLIVCGALFICGAIVGTAAAGVAGDAGLSDYMAGYLTLGGDVRIGGFFSALLGAWTYPLAAILLGFSVFGVFFVPALAAVRGFFLCFSISAIVRYFGGDGVLLALAIFGVSAAITVPCFFILAVQSFSSSLYVFKSVTMRVGVTAPYRGGFFRRILVCAAVLMGSALIDTLFVPRLIGFAAGRIA